MLCPFAIQEYKTDQIGQAECGKECALWSEGMCSLKLIAIKLNNVVEELIKIGEGR